MTALSVAFPWPRARGYGLFTTQPHSHGPITVTRKIVQGAGAGLLTLSGVGGLMRDGNLSEGAADALKTMASTSNTYDLSTIDGFTEALLAGAFNDPLQIAGAMIMFLSAGRCVARFVGFSAVMLAFGMKSQGITLEDVTSLYFATVAWACSFADAVQSAAF